MTDILMKKPVLEGEVRRTDDVKLTFTPDFSIAGYVLTGEIKSEDTDVKLADLTITNNTTTFDVIITSATTTLMTDNKYYSWVQWTDTDAKKHSPFKIVWSMV